MAGRRSAIRAAGVACIPDGRRTHLHLNPIVVREVIAQGWLEGRESPITPRASIGMRIARVAKAGKR